MQAILQEAIEGKLTSDWRASHPEVEPARETSPRKALTQNHPRRNPLRDSKGLGVVPPILSRCG
jgi:hypothetical protein